MNMEQVKEGKLVGRSIRWGVILIVGLLLFGWLLNTPEGLLGKADAVGYAVCHRIDVRSFNLGERQIPLCARCSGMYLGAMLGLAYQFATGRRRGGNPPWRVIVLLGILLLFFAVDGLNSYLHFFPGFPTVYEPQNWLRLLTGSGMGLVIAAALYPTFNQTVWASYDRRPVLEGWMKFGGLIVLTLLLDGLVLLENSLILYPLALISAAGVLILLAMVYTVLWVMLLRLENRFRWASQMLVPLIAGFGTGLLQIAVLNFIRYQLTGTWEGFHFG